MIAENLGFLSHHEKRIEKVGLVRVCLRVTFERLPRLSLLDDLKAASGEDILLGPFFEARRKRYPIMKAGILSLDGEEILTRQLLHFEIDVFAKRFEHFAERNTGREKGFDPLIADENLLD